MIDTICFKLFNDFLILSIFVLLVFSYNLIGCYYVFLSNVIVLVQSYPFDEFHSAEEIVSNFLSF